MRLALLCLAAVAAPALAADGDGAAPRRTEITVYGDDPCPTAAEGEIVVCAREPEEERYRIPRKLREKPVDEAETQTGNSRARSMDEAARSTMPNSCSPVGSGGQSGCTAQMLRAWREARQAMAAEAEAQARAEREAAEDDR